MWYYAWMTGLGLAVAFGILNAIWYEMIDDDEARESGEAPGPDLDARPR